MVLVRSWRRQLYGASAAAMIVPLAVVGALLALAFAGGFGRLGSLGQALSGPAVPAAPRPPEPVGGRPGGVVALGGGGVRVSPSRAAVRTPGAGTTTGSRPATGGAPASGAPVGGPRPTFSQSSAQVTGALRVPAPSSVPAPSPIPPPSAHGQGLPPPPPANPNHRPTLTDSVVGVATTVTGQLPAPAGQATTGALNAVGSALDQIAPLPAPGTSTPRLVLPLPAGSKS
jgi:hypothetical protein